jgi:hypothetical protein
MLNKNVEKMLNFLLFTDQHRVTTHFKNDEIVLKYTYQGNENPSFVKISWT